MHPDLEALIQAYDAALEAAPKDAAECQEKFQRRFRDVLSRTPGLSEDSLHNIIRLAHRRWLAKQHKPPIMPPKA